MTLHSGEIEENRIEMLVSVDVIPASELLPITLLLNNRLFPANSLFMQELKSIICHWV